MQTLSWESLDVINTSGNLFRMEVPGGWLIKEVSDVQSDMPDHIPFGNRYGWEWTSTICFYPDPEHLWLKPIEKIQEIQADVARIFS